MEINSKLRYLRIAPRKVRLVADLIRGKSVEEAQAILNFTVKRGVAPFLGLLNSAIASAKHNFQTDPGNLYISKLTVDEGPKFKRWQPRARGQAYEIQKKTSHITLVLGEIKEGAVRQKKAEYAGGSAIKPKVFGGEKPKIRPDKEAIKPKIEKKSFGRFFRRKAM